MNTNFQINDPSLETQWRAIILFGKNTATYKFAFAKALLKLVEDGKTTISLDELSIPYTNFILEHIKENKQGNFKSKFLDSFNNHLAGDINIDQLYEFTVRYGFRDVIDAFQNVNGHIIPNCFYEKNFSRSKKEIVITDSLLKLKDSIQFESFESEVEARWRLVETAWNFKINPNTLIIEHDFDTSQFFLKTNTMRRINVTSVRHALNGYQKGKCFYSDKDISIESKDGVICEVDHFFPHINKIEHAKIGSNINGVWNLVLADRDINNNKRTRIPRIDYLEKLFQRNEYYIQSKHPLAETIINQTGKSTEMRRLFLERQYNLAKSISIHSWHPEKTNPE